MWHTRSFWLGFFLGLALAPRLAAGPAPQLGIGLAGGQVTLSWHDPNGWLQASPALAPNLWTNVGQSPQGGGGTFSLSLPADQPSEFFRLVVSPVLPPPTRLSLQVEDDGLGNSLFYLWWDEVPAASAYNLYYAADPAVTKDNYGSLPQGAALLGITNLSALVGNLMAGIPYYFVATAVSAGGESVDSNEAIGIFGPHASLSGMVYIQLPFGTNATLVPLANVSVTMSNLAGGAVVARATTDSDGLYVFPDEPAGSYQLCWSAQRLGNGCYSNAVVISNSPVTMDLIVPTNSGEGLVWGSVTLEDGSPAVLLDPFYQIQVAPQITLADTNGAVLQQATPNSSGQYVMGGVPRQPSLVLSAQLEQASVSATINSLVVGEADLVIPNSPPAITNLVTTLGGQAVYRVPPGATVHVTAGATDPDPGDVLQYQWTLADGTLLPPSGPELDWTLPNVADGFQYLFLRVSDGNGGYDTARLGLTTNPNLIFSGRVTGADVQLSTNGTLVAPPVSNAVVQVNQLSTASDGDGYFTLLLGATNQYVLNISADGYVPLAKVMVDAQSGNEYRLVKITAAPCTNDTSQPICVNAGTQAQLCLPANSLQDAYGNSYPSASVSLDVLDPCDPANQFSDGNLVYNGTTNDSILDPFLIACIQVTNCYGQALEMNPTNCLASPGSATCAELSLSTGAACATISNAPPPSADLFVLNPGLGRWTYLATGTLIANTNLAGGFGYQVIAFLPFSPQGKVVLALGAASLQWGALDIRADTSLHVPFRVGFFKSNPKDAAKPGSEFVANGRWRDIMYGTDQTGNGNDGARVWFLPAGPLWIKLLDLRQAPGEYYLDSGDGKGLVKKEDTDKTVVQAVQATVAPFANLTVNKVTLGLGAGPGRQAQLNMNGFPTSADNKEPVLLARRPSRKTREAAVASGNPAKYYTGRANTYYTAIGADVQVSIDPAFAGQNKVARSTFARWQILNGWTNYPGWANDQAAVDKIKGPNWFIGDDAYAMYFNANDLGAGRRMGMKINGDSVAYYVATYATLADVENGQNLKYIVCMEYSPYPDGKKFKDGSYIKFYAFGGDGNRTGTVPDEDRHRETYVPDVCMVCHGGGNFNASDPGKGGVGGQFIVFDTPNYTFSTAKNWTRDDLKGQFTALNQSLNQAAAIMPGSDLNALITQIEDNGYTTTPLPGWARNADLYNQALAVSCRSCHSTQGARNIHGNGDPGPRGMTLGNLRPSFSDMPNAERTYGIYWGSATAKQLDAKGIVVQPKIPPSQPGLLGDTVGFK
jgi:hypothetical protein